MSLTGALFIVSYLVGLARSFIIHPHWGLYTYVAVFYLHPPIRWWGQSLPDLRWSLTAAIVTLLSMSSAKLTPSSVSWTSYGLTKFIFAYVAWMWLQIPWANPTHMEGVILLTKYIVLVYLIYRLADDERAITWFLFAHVVGCFYFGWLALSASGEGRLEQLGGPGVKDSNTLGMHVSTGLFCAAALVLTQRGWMRWAVLAMVPAIANCILQTESRGAFLGGACGALVYLLMAPRVYRKTIIGLGAASLMVLLAYAPATYWERMSTIKHAQQQDDQMDKSAESRLVIIKAQWQMFKDHPFGLGFDTTAYLSRNYLETRWLTAAHGQDRATQGARASHNTIMSILTDQGVPGIIIAGCAMVAVSRLVFRLKRIGAMADNRVMGAISAAVGASLTTSFVSGMFTNYIKAEVQLWMLALLISCLQIYRAQATQRQQAAVTDVAYVGAGMHDEQPAALSKPA